MTGLSGSGKSSLAFDTIYAEGQRRYVESLSAYARQFLGQMEKPDVDSIEGLSPAISIDQKTTSRNPRSTVGTVTEIYDYLRLLWARVGHPHCHKCGAPIAGPVDRADHRPADDAARGDAVHGHGAGRARAQGRVREAARRDPRPGLRAGDDRRRAAAARRGDRARQEVQARHLRGRRPAGDEGRAAQAARGVGRGGDRARRGDGRGRAAWTPRTGPTGGARRRGGGAGAGGARPRRRGRRRRRAAADLLGALRVPEVRHLDAGARAADLLLQLAARRLRALPRARLPARRRSRAGDPRPDAVDRRGRAAAVHALGLAIPPAALRGRRREPRDRSRHAVAGPAQEGPRRDPRGHRRRAPRRHLPQPLRPPPLLHGPLRRHPRRARAPLPQHRLRQDARADRVLHGAAALPGLRGGAAAAREPRGDRRRDQHPPVHASCRRARRWTGSRRSS